MKYSEILATESSVATLREYLVDGDTTAITIRLPKNLKEAASEAANLQGISFSAFVRQCIMKELVNK